MHGAGTDRERLVLRALRPDDAPAVRAIVEPELERLGHADGLRTALEGVIAARGSGSRALVSADGEHVVGVVVFGEIAGAIAAGRIQLVVVQPDARRRRVATRMIVAAASALAADGNRVVFVELPDDQALAPSIELLVQCGFHIDARVADYFRTGIDLAILRRDIDVVDARHQFPRSISS